MSPLTLFGVIALCAMLLFYALEEGAPTFVMCFALACLLSSAYGFLQGAWPFGIVEAVWTLVALRRWSARIRRRTDRPEPWQDLEASPRSRFRSTEIDRQHPSHYHMPRKSSFRQGLTS
jgi:hypothetical protein